MPEYLAPGVYVEETSYRAKSIEGVSTTTTAFIGPTRYGPIDLEPDIITSLVEFERTYGDRAQLDFGTPTHNYMWHAARAFFEEGGKRVYIARAFTPKSDTDNGLAKADVLNLSGQAADPKRQLSVRARFPGAAGNMLVGCTLSQGKNVLSGSGVGSGAVRGLAEGDVVVVKAGAAAAQLYIATRTRTTDNKPTWAFVRGPDKVELVGLDPAPTKDSVLPTRLTVSVQRSDGSEEVWDGLSIYAAHPNAITTLFTARPTSLTQARNLPIVISVGEELLSKDMRLYRVLFQKDTPELAADTTVTTTIALKDGNDGQLPALTAYEGKAEPTSTAKSGLKALEDIEDISIIAAPGSTAGYKNGITRADAINGLLIAHAENMRYRIAVIDSGDGQSISEVRATKARMDSKYAALYYPWIKVLDPVTREEIVLPPSGFVSGIYARNDINRAVYKAPANEVVRLALGFETMLNKAQQDVLNPEGINCFRFFEGRGNLLWGARTISSDPEWKYVNLRRYFIYLERSIDRGTQWAVFEPNGETLWANVRRTIEDFLFNEWRMGALLGEQPEKAFFVKCDRSTMTQNDLDNGRLVCLVGVAPLRPAEFVIFRIGQWTGDRKV